MPIPRDSTLEVSLSTGERLYTRCLLGPGRYRIGQERANEIWVDEPSISAKHAVLTITADGDLFLEDLQSSNGTYVEGEWIERPHLISLSTKAQVGACNLRLRHKAPYQPRPFTMPNPEAAPNGWTRKGRRT